MAMREQLEKMLAAGQETALLRFSLGKLYLQDGDAELASTHLQRAVALDPAYSAAWKLYGRALAAANHSDSAKSAFDQGIDIADKRGDRQAAKEMRVFRKRLLKQTKA